MRERERGRERGGRERKTESGEREREREAVERETPSSPPGDLMSTLKSCT